MHTQTHLTILIDRTASMAPSAHQVVDGLNYYVHALCSQAPGPVFATLATFAETVTVHYTQRPIHRVEKLRLETYTPEGQTALYDAIADVLAALPAETAQRQLLVILSDGEDVCSTTTLTACAELLAAAHDRGVLVVFLGDGPDALQTATILGIPPHCRYQFTARDGLKRVFDVLTTQTVQALEQVATRGHLPARFFGEDAVSG
jgi:von Willebrand factor type A domain